jgi:hypothetical protein
METETRELSSISRGKIRPGETDDWKNEKLFVPPLPPTNLRGCHIIRIQYDVFVSLGSVEIFFLKVARAAGERPRDLLISVYFLRITLPMSHSGSPF